MFSRLLREARNVLLTIVAGLVLIAFGIGAVIVVVRFFVG